MTDIDGGANPNIMILQPVKADEVLKRGRPKTKVNPDDVYKPPPINVSSTEGKQPSQAEKKQALRNKKQEIEEVKTRIVEDLNDVLIETISSIGVPAEFLYVSGKVPAKSVSSKYTELGNAFCINDLQANFMAHGWVEAKEVPALKKILGESKKEGPSYLWIGLGILGALSYIKQLTTAINEIKNLTNTLNSIKQQQEAQQEAPETGTRDFNGLE